MLPFLRNTTWALSGAIMMLAGCAAPSNPPNTEPTPHGTGTPLWASTVSNSVTASRFNAVLGSGNLYAVGTIAGTESHDFGNDVTVSGAVAGNNVVLVKYDSLGMALWARTLGSESTGTTSAFVAVAADTAGNIYAAGFIATGDYDFGDGVTASGASSSTNAVVVKYDSSGTAQWAQTQTLGEGTTDSQFQALATDSSGNVYAAGWVRGSQTYGFGAGVAVTATNDFSTGVLVKYDSSGQAQWVRRISSGSTDDAYYGLATDGSDHVYAAGYATASDGIDSGYANAVLVKYNTSGETQWARSASSGATESTFKAVAIDGFGNVYAAGGVWGAESTAFGNGVEVAAGFASNNLLLVKYTASGTAQWARSTLSASGSSEFNSLAADAAGHVYAAGSLRGNGTFDLGSITAVGAGTSDNLVLVKYTTSGTPAWAQTAGSGENNESCFYGVAAASGGSTYAVGVIKGTNDYHFGSSVTVTGSSPSGNAVLVRFD